MPSSDKAAPCTVSVVRCVSLLHVFYEYSFPKWLDGLSLELVGVVLTTMGNGLAFKVFNCIIRIWGLAPWVDIRNNRSTVKLLQYLL